MASAVAKTAMSAVRLFEKESMLEILRHVPAPVVVVTAAYGKADDDDLQVRGMTCSSFVSVSLDPPLVSICLRKQAIMMQVLDKAAGFGIHLLNEESKGKANDFAKPHETGKGPFSATAGQWELIKLGDFPGAPLGGSLAATAAAAAVRNEDELQAVPVLKDVMAALVCKKAAAFEAGDHIVLLGQVVATSSGDFHPLIYMNRHYHQIGAEV